MFGNKWKLPLIATAIDLIYLSFSVLCSHRITDQFSNQRTIQDFLIIYLPFFLHFPFSWLFYGVHDKWFYLLMSIQTFFIFFIAAFWYGKNKKRSLVILSFFYLALTGMAIYSSWDERIREPINVILPNGFTGSFSIFFGQSKGETLDLENGKYIVRIPSGGNESITNSLNGLHPYNFMYADGSVIPYLPVNGDGLGCFDMDEKNDERKFFIGTRKGYESLKNNN